MLDVTISCPSQPDKKPLQKKLPGTMAVGKLKALISRLLKLDVDSDIHLYYVSEKAGRRLS